MSVAVLVQLYFADPLMRLRRMVRIGGQLTMEFGGADIRSVLKTHATRVECLVHDCQCEFAARWEDSQYSLSLHRSVFSSDFVLVISSLRLNAEANEAIAKAGKVEEQEGPQKEIERQQKEAADLAAARLKNQKTFRP
ncbi:MAG TPA: hypothetical protein VIW93_02575 [Candidatus Acidoferrum sp.]